MLELAQNIVVTVYIHHVESVNLYLPILSTDTIPIPS